LNSTRRRRDPTATALQHGIATPVSVIAVLGVVSRLEKCTSGIEKT
jgi:hypothetical protein